MTPETYQLRDESTGVLLGEWSPPDYKGGERGALQAASVAARRHSCVMEKGTPSILTGPGLRPRRYVFHNNGRPYRVQGPCGHWVSRPEPRDGEPGLCRKCRSAAGQTERQKQAVAEANRERHKAPMISTKPGA